MQIMLKQGSGLVKSRATGFSFWQVVTTLLSQQEYDPKDKMRRFVFIMYLFVTFIVFNVALNDVGTKLVVTDSNAARCLQDLHDMDPSMGLYFVKEDWPLSKVRDKNLKKANQVYMKHCESRQSQCSLSHYNLLKMYADIASSFKVVSDQSVSDLMSRYFCGASSLDSKHDQFIMTNLDDLTTSAAIAFNARVSSAYRDIINSAAMKILEMGLVADGLYQRAANSDDEMLYSWRACTMKNPFGDEDGQVRKVTTKNFAWVAKISAVGVICATMFNILDNFLFKCRKCFGRKKQRRHRNKRCLKITKNKTILV
ncbi:hypothetical protein HDE_02280 [Halotydeus destructor]|nr:hypothetical protein HDE_02280 [Halotydeus destructor]